MILLSFFSVLSFIVVYYARDCSCRPSVNHVYTHVLLIYYLWCMSLHAYSQANDGHNWSDWSQLHLAAIHTTSGSAEVGPVIESCRIICIPISVINPWRACAARVAVVVLCVCVRTLFWQYAQSQVKPKTPLC